MATPNLVLCIVLIWCVSSVRLASQKHCRRATLHVNWKEVDNSTSIPQHDSGNVFDVLKNHCIEIILENIEAHVISCKPALLDGGTAAASSLNSGSGAAIKIRKITDTMSTKWQCDIIDPNIRILFELKVKGAKRVKMEINDNVTPFTILGLDGPNFDGLFVFQYEKPKRIHVKCKNNNGDLTLIFCSYVNPGMKECIKKTNIDMLLQGYHDNAYIDCIVNNKELKQSFVYRYIFKFNGTERDASSKRALVSETPDYEYNKNNKMPSTNVQFTKQPLENSSRVTNYNGAKPQKTENHSTTLVSKYDHTTLVIGCGASIIAVGVIACCIVFWCRRKKNASTLKNDLMELPIEDENATPQLQCQVNSNVYDYAYNISINIKSTRPLPPRPGQKSFTSHLKKNSIPSDEESNYYSEIDEYFINKIIIAKRQQK